MVVELARLIVQGIVLLACVIAVVILGRDKVIDAPAATAILGGIVGGVTAAAAAVATKNGSSHRETQARIDETVDRRVPEARPASWPSG